MDRTSPVNEYDNVGDLAREAARLSDTEIERLGKCFEEERRKRYAANQCKEAMPLADVGRGSSPARSPMGLTWLQPTQEVSLDNVDEVMRYQPWDAEQIAVGDVVRDALTIAVKAILRHVPRSPNRTKAINHIVDARMDANAAISFRGRF